MNTKEINKQLTKICALEIVSTPNSTVKQDGWEYYPWVVRIVKGDRCFTTQYKMGTAHITKVYSICGFSGQRVYSHSHPTPPHDS